MTSFGDARTRILLYFLFGIALPSGLLGYLAFRGIQNDRALVERERQNELQRIAAQVKLTVEGRLEEMAVNVSAAVSSWDSLRSLPAVGLARVLRADSLIESVFNVESGKTVRVVAGRGLRFRTDPPAQSRTDPESEWASIFRAARERELRSEDLGGALVLYRRALAHARDNHGRGDALNAVARVQRKLGDLAASGQSYERIRAEHADVQLSGGLPLGAAAGLEHAAVLLEAGDSTSARRVLLDTYADILEGQWVLTPAQFDFVTIGAMEFLQRLVGAAGLHLLGDSLAILRATEGPRRERAMALLDFEEEAQRLFDAVGGDGVRRPVVGRGRTFHTVLLDAPARAGSNRWGFTFNAEALATDGLAEVLSQSTGRVAWVLLTQDGDTLVKSSASPAPGSPTVTHGIGDFSQWTFQLSTAATGGTFLASRRAVYLYAFVLLAGILLFGLILTIRTIGRELELARMQSDFVSTVSHEFKSPLTAIRQMAEMLRADRVVSEERRSRYYDVLLEQSERLSMLVDNVLDFARMEERRRRIVLEPVDLGSLLEETVAEAQHRVAHEGFTIRVELSGPLPMIHLDAEAIRQALGNLIDNSVKYSGSSRQVIVSGSRHNGHVVIAVQDFGIGIEAGETGKVFDRFYRGGHELTRTVKGTGLGLTLVKQIVEAHAGVVEVRSEPGRGSTFSMRFPTIDDDQSTAQRNA